MKAETQTKSAARSWTSLDDQSSTEAFLTWSGSRRSMGRFTTIKHSGHEKEMTSQQSPVVDLVSPSPVKPTAEGCTSDEAGVQTADTTMVDITSSSLPSTYDDPISPKTLKATRNNPDVPGVVIKLEIEDDMERSQRFMDHGMDCSKRLDTDMVGHTPVKLQTPTQQQIAARVAKRLASLLGNTTAPISVGATENDLHPTRRASADLFEQHEEVVTTDTQIVGSVGTDAQTVSDTPPAEEHEPTPSRVIVSHVDDLKAVSNPREATPEAGVNGTILNPRAQSWHLPEEIHHAIRAIHPDVETDLATAIDRPYQNGDSPKHEVAHRSIVFHDLPKDADYYLVQSLVHGGSIQTMLLSEHSAVVTFTTEQACRLYVSKYPAGITFRYKNKLVTATVSQSTKDDRIDLVLAGQLSAGVSRVVRIIHDHKKFTVNDLHELAVGADGSRTVESVIDVHRSGLRSTSFRFSNIADSVKFKTLLTEDEEVWGDSNIRWVEDPCERTAGLHFD